MNKIILLFLSVFISLVLVSCSGEGDDGNNNTVPTLSAQNACFAASYIAYDSVSIFNDFSGSPISSSGDTLWMNGTLSVVSDVKTYTMTMTFTELPDNFFDDQGDEFYVSLTGGCNAVWSKNTATGVEIFTLTPLSGTTFVLSSVSIESAEFTEIPSAITDFNMVYTKSTSGVTLTGTATINGVVTTLNYSL